MRHTLFTLLAVLFCTGSLVAQELPTQKEILKTMLLTNDYFMKKWPDPSVPTFVNKERPSNLWTRAVYYEGLMALHEIYPRADFYKYAYDWGASHQWGMRNGNTTRHADNHCCGQTYIDLYRICPDNPAMLKNVKVSIDAMVNTPQVDDWWWIDAIQMAMPVFAKFGNLYDDTKYYDKMWQLYEYTRNQLGEKGMYNPKDDLWWRDADYDPPYTEPNGEDCYWSRGNGWVYAALVRVMNEIPKDEKHYKDYLRDFKAMSKALIKCQREDGFWNVSLHDPTNYGGPETSGTALFVYGMAWGIRQGILDADTYTEPMVRAWNAIVEKAVHPNGFLGYMQGTGKDPSAGQPVTYDSVPDFEDYGLGCVLLAGAELYKLQAQIIYP